MEMEMGKVCVGGGQRGTGAQTGSELGIGKLGVRVVCVGGRKIGGGERTQDLSPGTPFTPRALQVSDESPPLPPRSPAWSAAKQPPSPLSPQVAYLVSCYMPLDLLNDDMSEGRGHSDNEDDSYSGSDDEGGEDQPASAEGVGKCMGGSVGGRRPSGIR